MISSNVKQIAEYVNGTVIGNLEVVVNKVVTDSRKDVKDCLFVALKGDRFDAHDFINHACEAGASAVVVDHKCEVPVPQIIVPDTLVALGLIGQMNRMKGRAKVVSVTGTCGKTSVKEMTASILKQIGNTIYTQGNLNNSIGVPLSLLQINEETDYAVIELGANHPSEIAYSVNLARPEVAVINNVGAAHLEGFGDLLGVYKAKSEILDYVFSNRGIGIVNGDNDFFESWCKDFGKYNLKFFSVNNEKADCYASNIQQLEQGCFSFLLNTNLGSCEVNLNVPGIHNVSNALAASTLCLQVGASIADIKKGLEAVEPTKGRLYIEKLDNVTLIDDAYNASVSAVKSSIDTLSLLEGYKVFIFGDMGELGSEEELLHRQIGTYAKNKVDLFLSVGRLAKLSAIEFGGTAFDSKQELYNYLQELLKRQEAMNIIAKGAHGMKMNEVIDFIRKYKEKSC